MLHDRYRQLLTAYVDGELSRRGRRHLVRLLRRSQEARRLLKQLQTDVQLLRRIPQPTLSADLSEPILRTISERKLKPGERRIPEIATVRVWMRSLASWSAAAALLLGLGAGSYWCFANLRNDPEKKELVQDTPAEPSLRRLPENRKSALEDDKSSQTASDLPAVKANLPSSSKPPVIAQQQSTPAKSETADKTTKRSEDSALTERQETFPLDRVLDDLPEVFKVIDLEREAVRKKLVAELRKDREYRLELPCHNGSKALDRVEQAARGLHIRLVFDKLVQDGIKLKKVMNYALYIENITPEELARFLQHIGIEDSKGAAGKAEEEQIDRLVLTRMTGRTHKELATILGIDPTATEPTPSNTATDSGQAALVLPYNPARPTSGSEEIKRFLESRKPFREGTIRVLVVLRG